MKIKPVMTCYTRGTTHSGYGNGSSVTVAGLCGFAPATGGNRTPPRPRMRDCLWNRNWNFGARPEGNAPSNMLLAISNFLHTQSTLTPARATPDRREAYVRNFNLFNVAGMTPVSSFQLKSASTKRDRFPSDAGSGPDSPCRYKSRALREQQSKQRLTSQDGASNTPNTHITWRFSIVTPGHRVGSLERSQRFIHLSPCVELYRSISACFSLGTKLVFGARWNNRNTFDLTIHKSNL
jgi:hypothetical protein